MILAHPECRPDVIALADQVASTTGMIHYVRDHLDQIEKTGVIIGTEIGLIEQLQSKYPKLPIIPLTSGAICATQKLTTLTKVAWCIENEANEITLDEKIRRQAYGAVKRMIDLS